MTGYSVRQRRSRRSRRSRRRRREAESPVYRGEEAEVAAVVEVLWEHLRSGGAAHGLVAGSEQGETRDDIQDRYLLSVFGEEKVVYRQAASSAVWSLRLQRVLEASRLLVFSSSRLLVFLLGDAVCLSGLGDQRGRAGKKRIK
ncbi:hypothetical protein TEQG_08763 [Trichophyton equinum CBS 127.97]|uniref:Uncharacterized protein n=1 Tax=Trichophyton equinum (strain ATCC MYA-4606 / CBS 127.97) TaxID=559882 RepID=F2Q0H3_TRIEC|nr:hypothetical protein TEQG_08763 [Trichophyton equinum CBS 127.97]